MELFTLIIAILAVICFVVGILLDSYDKGKLSDKFFCLSMILYTLAVLFYIILALLES